MWQNLYQHQGTLRLMLAASDCRHVSGNGECARYDRVFYGPIKNEWPRRLPMFRQFTPTS